jgi:hypothetical protein
LYTISPHRPYGVGALWVRGLTKHSKILEFIGFFQTVFCFSDRSSILRDLGVTLIGESSIIELRWTTRTTYMDRERRIVINK